MGVMKRAIFFLFLALAGCRKESPPAPVPPANRPHEQALEGAYHAIACGPVTAVWSGNAEALQGLGAGAPKSFGVESLAFHFADGSQRGFAPKGQLFFSDWQFEIFAPDCSAVALKIDHYGPIDLIPVGDLLGYLQGRTPPTILEAPRGESAAVYGPLEWTRADQLEFSTEAGGGVEVFRASLRGGSPTVERIFALAEAPKGVRRTDAGWEAR